MPARVSVNASDGRGYAPDGGFHRVSPVTNTHYFPSSGEFEIEVPAGGTKIFAMRGPEYVPATVNVKVQAGQTTTADLRLPRLIDPPAMHWYSGDTHTHDLHQGLFGLTHEEYFQMLLAEDLHVTNALIHVDGTQWMGRPDDLTGEPNSVSTPTHILQYNEEYRGAIGHIAVLGIHEFVVPLISGVRGTVFADNVENYTYIAAAHKQGGIAGFAHPYTHAVRQPSDGADNEIAMDVALGHGDFFDVTNIPYDDLDNDQMYFRYLDAGFHLTATGGSDDFGNSWNGAPPGTSRTYAKVEGRLTDHNWLEAVKAGRTFGTTAPLVFMTVNGKDPGSEIDTTGPVELKVNLDVASIAPLDRVEVFVNGQAAKTFDVKGRTGRYTLSATVNLEKSGWVAARALGPSDITVADDYAFAQTTPVYVACNGQPYVSATDATFLDGMVAAMWQRLERAGHFASPEAKAKWQADVNKARSVYQERAKMASAGQ